MGIEKVVRGDKVAVLVSPEFGAGWSTWADNAEAAMFDPEVVEGVENGKSRDEFLEKGVSWSERFGYLGGAEDLEIEWIPVGSRFYIEEYDGNETLHVVSPDWGYVA